MTKAAQTTMPKMCHDRFAPSAKMDNTGRAEEEARFKRLARGLSGQPVFRDYPQRPQ
jgi:hypothetical protein